MPNNVMGAILESSEHTSMRLLAAATRASSLQAMSDSLHHRSTSTKCNHTTTTIALRPSISVTDAACYLCDSIFPDLQIARHEAQELLLVGLCKGLVPTATTTFSTTTSHHVTRIPSGIFGGGAGIVDSLMTYHFLQEDLVKSTLSLLHGGDGADSNRGTDTTTSSKIHLDIVCDGIEVGFPLFIGVLLSLTESMDDIEEFSTTTTSPSSASIIGAACSKQALIRKVGRPEVTQRILNGGI
eukprot:TRINITY_DN43207_c0_g1_i2.p1 TRINITY_DN43207_c0_g1~~TRINITY_DN43207_c0_g1_i2.p1  ORF type:complete len:241 (-),score=37.86 TRINITY_DN43207_c0_g1_i2:242-964(-)